VKRALSAFMFFSKEVRPIVSKGEDGVPKLSFAEIAREVSRKWKALEPEEKQKYEELNAQDKLRYAEELANAPPPEPDSDNSDDDDDDGQGQGPKKKRKKKRDPNLPKRPKTAFFFYMDVMRSQVAKEHPEMKVSERSKLLGQKWRGLTDDEKKPYAEQNVIAKEKYKEAMIEYKQNQGGD